MAIANLHEQGYQVDTTKDGIVIQDNSFAKRGGATISFAGYPFPVLYAGHVIIRETATNDYKPMPLDGTNTNYGALPLGHTYEGILINTITNRRPFGGISTHGVVNEVAAPYSFTAIKGAFSTAVPLILFTSDR